MKNLHGFLELSRTRLSRLRFLSPPPAADDDEEEEEEEYEEEEEEEDEVVGSSGTYGAQNGMPVLHT